ncbi:hexokinase [Coprinopsis sp. MPI-PUGE-AT-0042]|nr:hexokinase [Coprinopsis sp. MPI-PUGE-AT-0042]
MPPISVYHHEDTQGILDSIDRQLTISDEQLSTIAKGFVQEMEEGLNAYGKPMAMIPSFVAGVPDGTETGTFLALDLGGTNLRVCEVVLNGNKTFSLTQKKFKVSEALKTGEAAALFDYIADSVDAFLSEHSKSDFSHPKDTPKDTAPDAVYLGFTFSFPVEQTALASGKLLSWTKGFSAKNAQGNDIVQLLQDAFDRKHLHVKCVALVNDTVGTLLTRAYIAGGSFIGAIFGTGTNGAYVEEISKIKKLKSDTHKDGHMVINCEWGAFDRSKSVLPATPYDNAVDRQSINPGFQLFEKFISGMYLGEIVRLIALSLVDAAPKAILFSGHSSDVLNTLYGVDTAFMSAAEGAWIGDGQSKESFDLPPLASIDDKNINAEVKPKLEKIRKLIIDELHIPAEHVSLRDAAIIRQICYLVARRAGLLSGVAVASLLISTDHGKKNPNDTLGVGVDGSLVEHYPNYESSMRHSLRVLVGEDIEKRVEVGLAKDGSGVGAALCALQALKQLQS